MVDPNVVLSRYRASFDDHLDYDQPQDPIDTLRAEEYAFWDKVDLAFMRMVKRWVTPLVQNPALPRDVAGDLSLVFEKAQGDDLAFNTVWSKMPGPPEGCGVFALDTDWDYYMAEMRKRGRIKAGVTGQAFRDAMWRCESILSSLGRHYEGLRSLKDEHPIYAIIRERHEGPWREACSKIVQLAEYKARAMTYAYDAAELSSLFQETITALQALYKKELRPVYAQAREVHCHLPIAVDAMADAWRRYQGSIASVKKEWVQSSALLRKLAFLQESWRKYQREVSDRAWSELDDKTRKNLRDKETVIERALRGLTEIDEEARRAVRNYAGWPKGSPKSDLAVAVGKLGQIMRDMANV